MTNEPLNRRKFLQTAVGGMAGVAGVGAAGFGSNAARAQAWPEGEKASSGARPGNPIATSTYSFIAYDNGMPLDIADCIDKAGEFGFDAVEVLHNQMQDTSKPHLQMLKRKAFSHGMSLCSLSAHQDFVHPEAEYRQRYIDHTIEAIQLCHEMGIPTMRVSAGRWNTIPDFDDFMANDGIEPVMEGYTDEDGYAWIHESLEKCLEAAERYGVMLAVENHWGLARNADGLLRIVNAFEGNPWIGLTADTGNFLENTYEQLEAIAPQTTFLQAKTYYGGGRWYTKDLDYDRIARIFHQANYKGYVSLEFEGTEAGELAIPKSLALLREAFKYDDA